MKNDIRRSVYNGKKLKIEIFGASHSPEIGVTVKGFDKDTAIDLDNLQNFCNRRRAKSSSYSTTRIEEDKIIIKNGVDGNVLSGKKFKAIIKNKKQRSSDYGDGVILPRPSHADYVASVKYGSDFDHRGGGKFSGRLTAPMCIAGGIAKQILSSKGIIVDAFVSSIGKLKFKGYDDIVQESTLKFEDDNFRVIDSIDKTKAEELILKLKEEGDSVGGTIDCIVKNLPVGVGEYMFDSLESVISHLIFAVPAVKGIEFGSGFNISTMTGSIANDPFYYDGDKIKTKTNNNGGINGGISNGMPLTLRVAIKPTPSILKPQSTVNLLTGENDVLKIKGRHDACIVPRAVAVIEAMVCLAIYDLLEI